MIGASKWCVNVVCIHLANAIHCELARMNKLLHALKKNELWCKLRLLQIDWIANYLPLPWGPQGLGTEVLLSATVRRPRKPITP